MLTEKREREERGESGGDRRGEGLGFLWLGEGLKGERWEQVRVVVEGDIGQGEKRCTLLLCSLRKTTGNWWRTASIEMVGRRKRKKGRQENKLG